MPGMPEPLRNLPCQSQFGFRKERSTTDPLVRVINEVEKAIKMRELVVVIFLTLKKFIILCGGKAYLNYI